jgi:glycosyltransferase involved in cell wall biosynthesis
VAFDVGIAKEVVAEGINGYVCPVDDILCMADKISLISNSKETKTVLKSSAIKESKNVDIPSKQEYLRRYFESVSSCY